MQSVLPIELQRSRWRPTATQKRQLRQEAERFKRVRRAEVWYASQLRKVARTVGDIIKAFPEGDPRAVSEIEHALSRYAEALSPWARATAARMIAEVSRRDAKAWFTTTRQLGQSLRKEIYDTPIGTEVQRILESQVQLITSIPLEASRRVQQLTQEYVTGGRRYDDLVPMIQDSGNVTRAKATLIGRTEVARTASVITTVRAKYIGATHFVWRTARDADVRPLHKKLEGKIFALDDPPIIGENNERGLPGTIYNCRCWQDPILPAVIK